MTAPWKVIKDRLIAEGTLTEQGVTRTPKARHCRDCGRAVIAAITDLGFEIAVEPTPTTLAGELRVLLAGGQTYSLLDHGEMVWRNQHRIAWATPDQERTHARHDCDRAPPETNPTFTPQRRVRASTDGPPPF